MNLYSSFGLAIVVLIFANFSTGSLTVLAGQGGINIEGLTNTGKNLVGFRQLDNKKINLNFRSYS